MISDSVNSFHVGFVQDEENINTRAAYDLNMCMPCADLHASQGMTLQCRGGVPQPQNFASKKASQWSCMHHMQWIFTIRIILMVVLLSCMQLSNWRQHQL